MSPAKKPTSKVTPIKRKAEQSSYYQVKVMLESCPLPVWRRLVMRSDAPLSLVHEILQVVVGWGNNHTHLFITSKTQYGAPNPDMPKVQDHHHIRLSEVMKKIGDTMVYDYDLSETWHHNIVLEEIIPTNDTSMLARCLMGKRACPPEDVGGPIGYARFLEAIEDPLHEDHQDDLDWIECDFDPDAFDARLANMRLELMEDQIREGEIVSV